jgi:hypothetical protein
MRKLKPSSWLPDTITALSAVLGRALTWPELCLRALRVAIWRLANSIRGRQMDASLRAQHPDALTPAFANDASKQGQWAAFLEDVAVNPGSLAEVTEELAEFLLPHANQARKL